MTAPIDSPAPTGPEARMSAARLRAPAKVNDAIRVTLIEAAKYIERYGNVHPARAIFMVQNTGWKRSAAWTRLVAVAGMDYLDHAIEENIDDMIAAAVWENA